MYDGGYRPDRAFSKCTRIIGDVMGQFHPHGDSVGVRRPGAAGAAVVAAVSARARAGQLRLARATTALPPTGTPRPRWRRSPWRWSGTSTKTPSISQDNYDGRTQEPTVLPARFPNLLVNGSVGIAVGMATNIPPHNLREVVGGRALGARAPAKPRAKSCSRRSSQRVKGPDFPTGAQILGVKGIQDAYRTGRGSITMRAVVNVEELQGRTCLVVTELPYQVNPDNLAIKIADLVKEGKLAGIADIRDETSGRTGQRLVIVLKRDAVARVVLNNLYKHTQLQENFGANMLAIVDGVPRTLPIDGFITHWIDHQIQVIVRRTQFRLAEGRGGRAHPARLPQGPRRAR